MTTVMTSQPGRSDAPKKIKSILKKSNVQVHSTPLETHIETNEDDDGLTKRERLQLLIKKKKECDAKAKKIVEDLIEVNVERKYLLENVSWFNYNVIKGLIWHNFFTKDGIL